MFVFVQTVWFSFLLYLQQIELKKSIEELVFWCGRNVELHGMKNELIEQMNEFPININAKGFFDMNRRFLGAVSVSNSID